MIINYRACILVLLCVTTGGLQAQPAGANAAEISKKINLTQVHADFQNAKTPEERLGRVIKLGEAVPEMNSLSITDAESLGLSLSNPSLNEADTNKILKTYVKNSGRDTVAYKPELFPQAVKPANGASSSQFVQSVAAADFSQLINLVAKLDAKIDQLNARIADLETKVNK
jgi:hypothetical protein